jgi:hypothetical protein
VAPLTDFSNEELILSFGDSYAAVVANNGYFVVVL